MRARLQTVLDKLASLLLVWGIPAYYHLWLVHGWMNPRLREKQDPIGWLWRLFHIREWQKSTAQSISFWLLATLIIYKLIAHLGYGLEVSIGVSLLLEGITYCVNKLWVWRGRNVGLADSGGRTFGTWIGLFLLNAGLAWLLMSHAGIGTMHARYLLGCYGVAINPLIFVIRDKVVFNAVALRELPGIAWLVRKIAVA
jgi:hypothetical protein